MLSSDFFDRYVKLPGTKPPATTEQVEFVTKAFGRPVPDTLRSVWLAGAECWTEVPVQSPTHSVECASLFPVWAENGWIPFATDGFGNSFLAVPTPVGDVVCFQDIGFDPPEVLLEVSCSTIDRFFEIWIEIVERDEAGYFVEEFARKDPTTANAARYVERWLKKNG
ncbi:MAG: hypothetical protein D6692_00235 [Planctomycetota bacterium]|nr:MAG: hypothetical protein D6692_00235 [Planctomycetota bacterium]